ncbi:MAG: sigma-70 family RNA polymerase sigma factor [Oscillospiraceae bacterium]|nr:sigma-70 family RNA polymerase sigma factor [Oscillospiraceae bacterium]
MQYVEELYNRYFHDVRLYIKALSHSDDVAEEITQETFFKAMKSIGSFKGGCDVRVWLCQIAKNTYLTYCRKNGRFTGEEADDALPDTAASVEDRLIDKAETMAVHKILHKLEEPYKEVFGLRIFSELSFAQIAEVFGKTESWARVTFHRAKLKIINELEEQK